MLDPPIRCHGLRVGYDGEVVLDDVSFAVSRGETVSLVGRSGCGKTTLLKTIAGILRPLAGDATVLGCTLPDQPPAGTVGYIPQRLGLLPHETVLRNVLHGRLSTLGHVRSLLGWFSHDDESEAIEAIERVELTDKTHTRISELSGGQQRRVAIARAFVHKPEVLLADEILSELDHETARSIVRCLHSLQAETGMAVLIVEHNLDIATDISDTVLSIENRKLTQRTGRAAQFDGISWDS